VAERAEDATLCLDTFHLIGWAADGQRSAPGGVEPSAAHWRSEGRQGVQGLALDAAGQLGEPTSKQKGTIRELERVNTRAFRAWQLKNCETSWPCR